MRERELYEAADEAYLGRLEKIEARGQAER
jgi:hypothetical protein